MNNFSQWAWGVLLVPIWTLFTAKADKSDLDKKADQSAFEESCKSNARTAEQVDAIYKYLVEGKR